MIRGKKIGLRSLEREDLPQLRDWRNIPDFRKNFREFRELNLENQNTWFEGLSKSKSDFMFGIIELSSNSLIGACGLLYIDWIIRSGDFSFYIGKDNIYIGDDEGLSLEAAELLVSYGFNTLNLNKIWMELYEFDSAKYDFFTKELHFKLDGKLRENCFHEGRFYNSNLISRLKSD